MLPFTPLSNPVGIGSCMDCAVENGALFVISNDVQYMPHGSRCGCLRILSLRNKLHPQELSRLEYLGNVRQLIVRDGIAYISAREDGLWIIDVHDLRAPKVLLRYDPIEFATGLALEGSYLYVACRVFGVEVIDVSDPAHPQHRTILRTGEAQSLTVRNGFSFSGVWGSMEVVIHDVRDLGNPKEVCRIPLQGRGDGVFVKDDLLFAVSGHHGRTDDPRPILDFSSPTFGKGWGFEIFDISELSSPRPLSKVNIPVTCYYPEFDMWNIQVSGNYAFLTLSFLGAFVYDVSDPQQPVLVRRYEKRIFNGEPAFRDLMEPNARANRVVSLPFDYTSEISDPCTNLALGDGVLYLATGCSDLYAVEEPLAAPVSAPVPHLLPSGGAPSPYQVHGVFRYRNLVYAACGNGGGMEYAFSNGKLTLLRHLPSEGIVYDVLRTENLLILAEGSAGVHLLDAETLSEISVYRDPQNRAVLQAVLSPNGRFLLLHIGFTTCLFLDILDPQTPKAVLEDVETAGFYCRQIMNGAYCGKYMAVFRNARGTHWYDVSGNTPVRMPWEQKNCVGAANGLAAGKNVAIAVHHGGYELFDPRKTQSFEAQNVTGLSEGILSGKPFLSPDEKTLYVSDRVSGELWKIDLETGRVLSHEKICGDPDLIAVGEDVTFRALGYDGLSFSPVRA